MLGNVVLDSCASTNDLARALGEAGHPDGTWISARKQTAGRGRQGRSWVSDEGNLFLSLVVRSVPRERWTWVPLTTAIAVRDAVTSLRSPHDSESLSIKWPNDLWLSGAKVAGILCEAVNSGAREPFLVVGLGVNCMTPPDVSDQPVACAGVDADELRPRVLASFKHWLSLLARPDGTRDIAREYDRWSALRAGAEIAWGANERGTVIGLGEWSELRVKGADGVERKLMAEDVRAVRASRTAGD